EVAGHVTALGTGHHAQVALVSLVIRGEHLPDTSRIRGDRLLREEVLARGDGGGDVQRPEARRRGQHDVVRGGNHLLIGVKADKAALFGNIHAIAKRLDLLVLHELVCLAAAVLQPVLEDVAQRNNLNIRSGVQHIIDGPGTAAAAADQADLDHIAAGRVDIAQHAQVGCEARALHGRALQEISPRLLTHENPSRSKAKSMINPEIAVSGWNALLQTSRAGWHFYIQYSVSNIQNSGM